MALEVTALFTQPETLARHLGENIGTHYVAALRAAEAYARHLAGNQKSLASETFLGDGLGDFWRELIRSEQLRLASPAVLKQLSTDPSYYFKHFLNTADAVYAKSYEDGHEHRKKKLGQTQHAQCLRMLRDPDLEGLPDRFTVHNRITLWGQMLQITTGFKG